MSPKPAALVAAALVGIGTISISAAHGVPTAAAASSNPLLDPVQLPQGSSLLADTTPNRPAATGEPRVVNIEPQEGHWFIISIYSPSMDRVIRNNVLLAPGDAPRPTLYLLQGSEGGENNDDWPHSTNYREFFADKQVNVISPLGGAGSLFLDWGRDDPVLGANAWSTYISEELPQVMESQFHSDDRRALAGMSMAGSAVLNIAAQNPGRYRAVASLSGYPALSSPLGRVIGYSMALAHFGQLRNALGFPDDPRWTDNDPSANVEGLRGIRVFISSGDSVPASLEVMREYTAWEGVVAELPARALNDKFYERAVAAGVDITYSRDAHGLHYWPYFEQSLYKAWETTVGPALGV
ncbi:alpha/beta hydrolase family protein [uncultured Corynebacterium sp.]|uniref:alpha/beta hydrolase n=1 Tax=uncultured Corynebacterium sp. TaxID=159447 RepID=UPI0025E0D8EF|nr:alpha/beta hydrolase family protein [uncultured Corynebacterium sp.]